MPRFVPQGVDSRAEPNNWVARHAHNGEDELGVEGASRSHRYASNHANLWKAPYREVGDELGEPCIIFPNAYDAEGQPITPEGQSGRLESRGR